jgi:hypothetical protein
MDDNVKDILDDLMSKGTRISQIIISKTKAFSFIQTQQFTLGKIYAFAQKQKSKLLKH